MRHIKSHSSNKCGFTITEVMVALAIALVLAGAFWFSIEGFKSKRQLSITTEKVRGFLLKAQQEAARSGFWTCLTFSNTSVILYKDEDQNHATHSCGTPGDIELGQISIEKDAPIAICNAASSPSFDPSCDIWVTDAMEARRCPTKPCFPTLATTVVDCIPWDFQIIFSLPDLPSGARSQEIEFTRFGKVIKVLQGDKGHVLSTWAKHESIVDPGACE